METCCLLSAQNGTVASAPCMHAFSLQTQACRLFWSRLLDLVSRQPVTHEQSQLHAYMHLAAIDYCCRFVALSADILHIQMQSKTFIKKNAV
jgi:hypothetical protein